MDDSAVTCDEIIEEEAKTVTTSSNKKMQSLKQKLSIFYLTSLLITIALLIAVSIYLKWMSWFINDMYEL